MKTHTAQFLKRRKFLMVLPLMILVFSTLAFASMGGGKSVKQSGQTKKGLSRELPEANLSTEPLDKMSLYNQDKKDSLDLQDHLYGNATSDQNRDSLGIYNYPASKSGMGYPPAYGPGYTDPNEARVKAKLAELEQVMNQPAPSVTSAGTNAINSSSEMQLAQMEAMMRAMSGGETEDPEIRQLNNMLEKIMDIQNPERSRQKLKQLSGQHKGRVYGINQLHKQNTADLLNAGILVNNKPGFYDLDSAVVIPDTLMQTAIPAVVHETQTLVAGSTIKMRLTEPVYINGTLIPKGTFVSGICSIDGERLKIEVSGLRLKNNIYPISLAVYDLDAIEGIRVPDAITRDAAKEGADRAVQSLQLMSIDPSFTTQAAGAGVEAAKGLFGKKAKLIRVTVKAGYPLLFVDLKAKQESN